MDEAGTSYREPTAIVASIFVDPDTELRGLRDEIAAAVEEMIPLGNQSDFYFHSKDVFGKYKKLFGWDIDQCNKVMERWLSIVPKFDLTCIVSWHDKPRNYDQKTANQISHLLAFILNVQSIDALMERFYSSEIASIFSEDCPESRKLLQATFKSFESGGLGQAVPIYRERATNLLQGVAFLRKDDAAFLQLADAAAFAFRRYRGGLAGGGRLFQALLAEGCGPAIVSQLSSPHNACIIPKRDWTADDLIGLRLN